MRVKWWATSCSCPACQRCCERTPGWLLPVDVELLAHFLGVAPFALFGTHLAFDEWIPEEGGPPVVVVSPATVQAAPGTDVPFGAAAVGQNRCLLYRDGRCTIHSVRPTECAQAFGCRDALGADTKRRRAIARAWDTPAARAQVAAWRRALGLFVREDV